MLLNSPDLSWTGDLWGRAVEPCIVWHRILAVDSLGTMGWGVGPACIGLMHSVDGRPDCDLGSFEANSQPWAVFVV